MSENSHNLVPKIDESMSVRNEFDEEAFPLNIRLGELRDVPVIQNVVRDAYEQYVAAEGSKPAPMTADYSSLAWIHRAGEAVDEFEVKTSGEVVISRGPAVGPSSERVGSPAR